MTRLTRSHGPATAEARSTRRGSILVELAIASAMMAVAMAMAVKVLGYSGQQRRSSEQRQRAMLEASNILERITARPFDEVTPERVKTLSVPPESAGSLPSAELTVDVKDERPGTERAAKRIAVRLRWKGRSGEWESPVRLTTWIERGRPSR